MVCPMASQTCSSKRAFRELQNWRVQENLPTLRKPCANLSPTFRQPFANLFCQPLSKFLFMWNPGTRLETRVALTCFHASFFLFAPFAGHPSSSPFLGAFRPFLSLEKCCSVEQGAQHRAWRRAVSAWTSPQNSGRQFLPKICVK